MTISALTRRLLVIAAVAGFCATAAGCVSDMTAPTASSSDNTQMRYYGGPKSPMWRAPAD
jgi:hypothetical protein